MLLAAKKGSIMSRLGQALRRREVARNRRALDRAIASAPTPAMRDELIIAAQRAELYGRH